MCFLSLELSLPRSCLETNKGKQVALNVAICAEADPGSAQTDSQGPRGLIRGSRTASKSKSTLSEPSRFAQSRSPGWHK